MDEVLVVGAGPVGLTLALELARHGVRCRIIDKAPAPSRFCRAIGVTSRTLEVWERMGVARSMIEAGIWITGTRSIIDGTASPDVLLPELGLPYAHLGLPQYETERILTEDLARRGIAIQRNVTLDGLRQTGECAVADLHHASGTTAERFAYVVGCDGAHSQVRRAMGATFDGDAYPWSFMLGDVHIDWDLPYGMTLRALRLAQGGPPDLFIAIPLPEPGRFRVSMRATAALSGGTTAHGIQSEMPGPGLADLQAVADDLLDRSARLSDLRWSSVFRISMRLASRYRNDRLFIAGDAAHIHPPTGGQGMNTGIQDAHNLAWKLALSLRNSAAPSLLDSYEAERRPVGADVIARTRAASERFGREQRQDREDRLADTQIRVAYRGSPIVHDDAGPESAGPQAGDRAPDLTGLQQQGLGFPRRLFDVLDGPDHVMLICLGEADDPATLDTFAIELRSRTRNRVRLVAIVAGAPVQRPNMTVLSDAQGQFDATYGPAQAFLIRPDGHIAWRGRSWRDASIEDEWPYLQGTSKG